MLKAIIFDIDGTLVDSVELHADCWRKAFQYYGKNIPHAMIRPHIGIGGDRLVQLFFSTREIKRFGKALDRYRDRLYQTRYLPRVRPFPRVQELFAFLQARGIQLALASSAKRPELQHYKKILKIAPFLSAEVSADDAEFTKPSPDIFKAAYRALHHPSLASTLVIGDSPYDALAAQAAGLQSIGVLSGKFSAAELRSAGCRAVFQNPADLLKRYFTIKKFGAL